VNSASRPACCSSAPSSRRPPYATIALAIAANTLMFGIIRAVLLNPLPIPEPERLVRIEQVHHAGVSDVTGATFVDLRARARTLAAAAAFRVAPATFSDPDTTPIQASATAMTAGYFDVLAVHPIAGRAPAADDFRTWRAPGRVHQRAPVAPDVRRASGSASAARCW
jgi:hypothetical protein